MKQMANLAEQYAKFPEISQQEIKKFVEWIHAQPHIPSLSELEALIFFHACKCSMETSKQVLDINFTCRTHCGEFFAGLDCDSAELQKAIQIMESFALSKATTEGYRVMFVKLKDYSLTNFSFGDILKLANMMFDMWMLQEGLAAGHIIVLDLKGFTLGHLTRISIIQVKKFLYYLQEAMTLRLIGLHFINIVPFMDKIMALMTPFMKKELTSMLHMHSNMEDFYKFVPRDILPKEFGGTEGNCKELSEHYINRLKANRLEMLEFEKRHQINEKLRPGKPKNASDLFGIEGNFKKLDID